MALGSRIEDGLVHASRLNVAPPPFFSLLRPGFIFYAAAAAKERKGEEILYYSTIGPLFFPAHKRKPALVISEAPVGSFLPLPPHCLASMWLSRLSLSSFFTLSLFSAHRFSAFSHVLCCCPALRARICVKYFGSLLFLPTRKKREWIMASRAARQAASQPRGISIRVSWQTRGHA